MAEHNEYEFVDTVPDDLMCSVCLQPAMDPVVTEHCGHLFCRTCIIQSISVKQECPVDRTPLKEDGLRRDIRAHRQVGGLNVKCLNHHNGCAWVGPFSSHGAHLNRCEHQPETCPLAYCGCSAVVANGELAAHEYSSVTEHVRLLSAALHASTRERGELKHSVTSLLHTVRQLSEEIDRLKQGLDTTERTLGDGLQQVSGKLAVTMGDVALINETRGFQLPVAGAATADGSSGNAHDVVFETRLDEGAKAPFTFAAGRREATHCTPGWATAIATSAVHCGRRSFQVEVLIPTEGAFNESAVMIGFTPSRATLGQHIGNVRGSFCLQGNAFVWDGSSCKAYGEPFGPGDTITATIDYDAKEVRFAKNGRDLGVAFQDVACGALFPAVSLCSLHHSVRIGASNHK